jgi:aryl-alcohol dehydrogenase-like predicted oxidoreductase
VPFSPLGRGFLTGTIRSREQFDPTDFRADNPRFTQENFQHNLHLADQVAAVAQQVDATPAQVALAWLLAQGDDIAPIPGTRRVTRIEENAAADSVVLTEDQLATLSSLPPAAGNTHNDAQMRMMER